MQRRNRELRIGFCNKFLYFFNNKCYRLKNNNLINYVFYVIVSPKIAWSFIEEVGEPVFEVVVVGKRKGGAFGLTWTGRGGNLLVQGAESTADAVELPFRDHSRSP